MKPHAYQVGEIVRVLKVPADLQDAAGIGTPQVFHSAVGRTFCIEGFDEHGHLKLCVSRPGTEKDGHQMDAIWIEPELVEPADDATGQLPGK